MWVFHFPLQIIKEAIYKRIKNSSQCRSQEEKKRVVEEHQVYFTCKRFSRDIQWYWKATEFYYKSGLPFSVLLRSQGGRLWSASSGTGSHLAVQAHTGLYRTKNYPTTDAHVKEKSIRVFTSTRLPSGIFKLINISHRYMLRVPQYSRPSKP